MKFSRKLAILYLLVITIYMVPIIKANSSTVANYVGEGDLVLMDYSIFYEGAEYNTTTDVYVYIGSAASVPIHLDNEYYIITHPSVFWEKLIGAPVPTDGHIVITLNETETTAYSINDFVFGKEINFHVTLKEIVFDDSIIRNPLSNIPFLREIIILILLAVGSFVIYKLYVNYKHLIIQPKKCSICGSQTGVGKCNKCGIVYCRKCFFDKGCLECRSNQFKPFDLKLK